MNIPVIKMGLVATSRDCFRCQLSVRRRQAVKAACDAAGIDIFEIPTPVENEKDAMKALDEAKAAGVNALVVYLGNFGPEGPETKMAQKFDGPVMFVAAAEEPDSDMIDDRGDAYCGMLNASYSIGLRNLTVYIPEYPVGTSDEVAAMIGEFLPIATAYVGVKNLKVFGFGPAPTTSSPATPPSSQLFDLGVEIQENSSWTCSPPSTSTRTTPHPNRGGRHGQGAGRGQQDARHPAPAGPV